MLVSGGCTFDHLTPKFSQKKCCFKPLNRFFGCHAAKWGLILLKKAIFFYQKNRFPEY